MGNLGYYQLMTTAAKKVGGPLVLLAATAVGGWAVGRTAEAGGKSAFKAVKSRFGRRSTPCATKGQTFKIHTDGGDDSGLDFRVGDEYTVLECDADAILIEILNNTDNPYFVSSDFLAMISDFPTQGTTQP